MNRFIELLRPFAAIAPREKQGSLYLKKILGKEFGWVLDPTLLLNIDIYDSIAKRPKEKSYLLVYNVTENDLTMVKEAIRFARKKGLAVIEVSNYALNHIIGPHSVKVGASVEEWIGYIKNADIIVTNSFHGFCFSILYHKDVYLFQRNDDDYKMQNLAESLSMGDRLISYKSKIIPLESTFINWDKVDVRLSELKRISDLFIKKEIIDYCN